MVARAALAIGSALSTLQCAKLEPLGSGCGNGAIDPAREDCDGSSYVLSATPTPGRAWRCERPGSPSECRFVCGPSSLCPNDDWACRAGVCINVLDELAPKPFEVLGAAGHVKAVDFDSDGRDEALVEPMSVDDPYAVHVAIADSTKTSVSTLFPAEAVSLVDHADTTEHPALVAQLDDGLQVTLARARFSANAVATGELEAPPFASVEEQGAGVDFLYPASDAVHFDEYPGTDSAHLALLAWVHGAGASDDAFAKFDFTSGKKTVYFKLAAIDQHGASVGEHRIVIAIPSDKKVPCMRLAVFTRDATDPGNGLLQVLTPDLETCDWAKAHTTYALSGHYPAARQSGTVFVADLDGDGANDLILNARKTGAAEVEALVLRGPLTGKFVPLLDDGESAQTVVLAAGNAYGYAHPAILTCARAGAINPLGLCLSAAGADRAVLSARFPNETASAYPSSAVIERDSRIAGFSDLNGDGYDDIWTWTSGSTGPSYVEATPSGFFASGLFDHASPDVRIVASVSLDESAARDLVAVTESRDSNGLWSELRVTRGNPLATQMRAKIVARLPGRITATVHDTVVRGTLPSIPLVTCISGACDGASDSREGATFAVSTLRPLAPAFLAAPAFLGCPVAGVPIFDLADPHPRLRKRIGAAAFSTITSGDRDTQVVTVTTGRVNSKDERVLVATLRWGRMRVGEITDHTSCGDSTSILHLSESVALAPTFTGGTDPWLMLGTYSNTAAASPDPRELKGVAYALTPSSPPKEMAIIPAPAFGDYRAIYAEAHDVDGDGDNDFVVLERKDSPNGTSVARPVFYMNAPCEDASQEHCLFVKQIDIQVNNPDGTILRLFADASGDGLAFARSHIDVKADAHWPDWWLATIAGDVNAGTGRVVTQRIRVVGVDTMVTFVPAGDAPPRETPTPQSGATHQEIAWGDFDGDGVLDLLYATDRGSQLYRRADRGRR